MSSKFVRISSGNIENLNAIFEEFLRDPWDSQKVFCGILATSYGSFDGFQAIDMYGGNIFYGDW